MSPWQTRLEQVLSETDAPPVLTRDLVTRFARTINGNQSVPISTMTWWVRRAVRSGKLQPVQRGLYLNQFRAVPGRLADAAPWLYNDAVVSLNTVLGDAGVLNNPSLTVTAVVPIDATTPPRLGRKKTQAGAIHFFGIPRRILEAGKPGERLESTLRFEHPRAAPEKALVDWIYLGQSPRSHRTLPPRHDIDLTNINLSRLRRLAAAAGMKNILDEWIGSKE